MLLQNLKAFNLAGMVVTDELLLLAYYAGMVSDASIVEVGSYLGRSAAALAEGSREDVRIYAVDPYERYQVSDPEGRPFVYQTVNRMVFIGNIDKLGFGDRITQLQLKGTEAGELWDAGPVGLLFIDAKHDYDSVAADFAAWDSHVVTGGYVAFHDYGAEPGVMQFVEELLAGGRYAVMDVVRTTIMLKKIKESAAPAVLSAEKSAKK